MLKQGTHEGVAVEDVVPGSPASQSALSRGDEILAVDGVLVHEPKALSQVLGAAPAGKPVTLTVLHEGKPRPVTLSPAIRPGDDALLRKRLLDRPAPAFSLPRVIGSGNDTLESHRGHVLLIDFWATWCGPCIHALPELAALHRKHGKALDLVGISTEPTATLLKGITEYGIGHPVLADVKEDASRVYGVLALPTLVLIDKKGVVRQVEVGANVEAFLPTIDELIAEKP